MSENKICCPECGTWIRGTRNTRGTTTQIVCQRCCESTKEIPLKEWHAREAELLTIAEHKPVTPTTVRVRRERGKYPNLQERHVNQRVILVTVPVDF